MTARWLIYALVDPRDGAVFYVGRSSNGLARPRAHFGMAAIRDLGHLPVTRKCRRILAAQIEPGIVVLEEHSDGSRLNESERACIAKLRASGVSLTNVTAGGDGTCGWVPSPETRAKMSASLKGRPVSEEMRARIAATLRGRKAPPEARANQAAAQNGTHSPQRRAQCAALGRAGRGRTVSDETRSKIALAVRSLSPEWRARAAEKLRGRKLSPEHVAKLAVARAPIASSAEWKARAAALGRMHKGRKRSEETRARISEALRRRVYTAEQKAKRSALAQAQWARQKAAGILSLRGAENA
jgi:hypothetical protein